MKDISETHPSLHGRIFLKWYEDMDENDDGDWIRTEDVQKHTVDKAVLRSIIEEVSAMEEHNSVYCDSFKAELLERLGLGDEE